MKIRNTGNRHNGTDSCLCYFHLIQTVKLIQTAYLYLFEFIGVMMVYQRNLLVYLNASVVYLVGDSDAAKAKGFSYIVGSTYNAQLKTDADAIKYYEVILATKTEDGTANEVLKVKATDTALLNTLIASSNYGKLFYIETTGGYVSAVTHERE